LQPAYRREIGNSHRGFFVCVAGGLMVTHITAAMLVTVLGGTAAAGQTKKPAGTNSVTYDVTITTEGPYTGTMDLATAGGKVTGAMHITQPTEITGKVAGTVKGSEMVLDFPYQMVQRNCTGQIAMNIKLPAKGSKTTEANGTVSIAGCGRADSNKLAGTIDLTPAAKKK
jgi:hypothetical protein